jgi:hypothetical protein
MRLNLMTHEFKKIIKPYKYEDGFEWSENLDGYQKINNNILYYNLKFICDKGGAQTRTLINTYHFINAQHKLLHNNTEKIYFINILDGDCSYYYSDKFLYLKKKYKNKNIFIGDMKQFYKWFMEVI